MERCVRFIFFNDFSRIVSVLSMSPRDHLTAMMAHLMKTADEDAENYCWPESQTADVLYFDDVGMLASNSDHKLHTITILKEIIINFQNEKVLL